MPNKKFLQKKKNLNHIRLKTADLLLSTSPSQTSLANQKHYSNYFVAFFLSPATSNSTVTLISATNKVYLHFLSICSYTTLF